MSQIRRLTKGKSSGEISEMFFGRPTNMPMTKTKKKQVAIKVNKPVTKAQVKQIKKKSIVKSILTKKRKKPRGFSTKTRKSFTIMDVIKGSRF